MVVWPVEVVVVVVVVVVHGDVGSPESAAVDELEEDGLILQAVER